MRRQSRLLIALAQALAKLNKLNLQSRGADAVSYGVLLVYCLFLVVVLIAEVRHVRGGLVRAYKMQVDEIYWQSSASWPWSLLLPF